MTITARAVQLQLKRGREGGGVDNRQRYNTLVFTSTVIVRELAQIICLGHH